ALYRHKGYYYAHVGEPVSITDVPGGGKKVVFTVVEGPQVKVEDVVVTGNTTVSRKAILDVMQTKPGGLFSPTYLNDEALREDVVEIRRLLRSEGLLDAEVVLEDLRKSDGLTHVVVVIAVTEGERYGVGDVGFEIVHEEGGRTVPGRIAGGPGAMPPEDRA